MAMIGGTAAVLAAIAALPATLPLRASSGGGDASELASTGPLPVLDCDVTQLPLPEEYAHPGPGTFPHILLAAMDPTGRYAVANASLRRSGDAGVEFEPDGVVLWDDGRPTAPSPLRGNAEASDVNADGMVVGGGEESGYAWIYREGQMSRLPIPKGFDSAAAGAINAAGDVAGTATNDDGRQTMVVWPADDIENPRVLAAPPGQALVASGITDDGLVVGEYHAWQQSGDRPVEEGGYLWKPDGSLVELPVPEGAYTVYGTAARGNWAVGQALLEPEGPQSTPTPSHHRARCTRRWSP